MTTIAASKIATLGASIGTTIPSADGLDPILDPNNPDLLAFYTMDNISGATLFDESPNSVDGTITGATAVPGQIGNALDFPVATDNVNMGDVASLNFGSGQDFTLCAWVNTSDSTKNKVIIDKRDNIEPQPEAGWFLAVLTDGRLAAFAAKDFVSGTAQANSTTTVDDGTWHFCVAQFDRDDVIKVYIDNGSAEGNVSMAPVGAGSLANTGDFMIGLNSSQMVSTSVSDMIGSIDQVRIFNRLLTSDERTALFNGGAGA
jgi:hypothetical protein